MSYCWHWFSFSLHPTGLKTPRISGERFFFLWVGRSESMGQLLLKSTQKAGTRHLQGQREGTALCSWWGEPVGQKTAWILYQLSVLLNKVSGNNFKVIALFWLSPLWSPICHYVNNSATFLQKGKLIKKSLYLNIYIYI